MPPIVTPRQDRAPAGRHGARRWLIGLLVLCFVGVAIMPGTGDSRPRSAKARALKAAKKEQGARRDQAEGRRARGREAPTPAPLPPSPLPLAAQPAPEDIPPLPERRAARPASVWPRTLGPIGPEPPPEVWPEAEIRDALARCQGMLGPVRFDFKALEPIRKGVCGTPAPIQLKYINDTPRVELRPAATMSCPLAAAIDRWMTEVVQPRAKALLDATVIRVVNLAAYDCRPRYGNPSERMSYHAYAEAIDIAGFVTAKGERINVLEHWSAGDERAQFLRDIHDGGCGIFGTVLGPEANAAHRNHFHVDIAKRRRTAFCE